ncbi:MAG: hypothetical protein WC458_03080 [Patescibacteria group bacterium]
MEKLLKKFTSDDSPLLARCVVCPAIDKWPPKVTGDDPSFWPRVRFYFPDDPKPITVIITPETDYRLSRTREVDILGEEIGINVHIIWDIDENNEGEARIWKNKPITASEISIANS